MWTISESNIKTLTFGMGTIIIELISVIYYMLPWPVFASLTKKRVNWFCLYIYVVKYIYFKIKYVALHKENDKSVMYNTIWLQTLPFCFKHYLSFSPLLKSNPYPDVGVFHSYAHLKFCLCMSVSINIFHNYILYVSCKTCFFTQHC